MGDGLEGDFFVLAGLGGLAGDGDFREADEVGDGAGRGVPILGLVGVYL